MIVITSAAYVGPGLMSEFGQLPPCMLPVKNQRLYRLQVAALPGNEPIILSLPGDFPLAEHDRCALAELGVKVVFVPEGLSLGASVVYVLNVIASYGEPLKILHGDTLLGEIPREQDVCSIAEVEDNYAWSYACTGDEERKAFAGYFAFSDQSLLIQKITECNYGFISGIREYGRVRPLKYCLCDFWYDFSMIHSFYRSRSHMTTQRVFNNLEIDRYSVKKYSSDTRKMQAEAHWFRNMPVEMKHFIPALWDSGLKNGMGYYKIEYFYLSSLADFYVFGKCPLFIWKNMMQACADFIAQCYVHRPANAAEHAQRGNDLYGTKTRKRLREYLDTTTLSADEPWTINGIGVGSLNRIVDEISREMQTINPQFVAICHGDFCFSNILYDFQKQSIRVVDPRGLDIDGQESIYGDIRYDVSKLGHSVLGMYDFIIGGNYRYAQNGPYDLSLSFPEDSAIREIQRLYKSMPFAGFSVDELSVYPIMVHLFLSMLPLHSDHPRRQHAMLANALRLYAEYKQLS